MQQQLEEDLSQDDQQQEFDAIPRPMQLNEERYRPDLNQSGQEQISNLEEDDYDDEENQMEEEEEEQIYEQLQDKKIDDEDKIMHDFYIDRPLTPELRLLPPGIDKHTQILNTDLFDYRQEVEPVLQALVGRTLQQSLMELTEDYEKEESMKRKKIYQRKRQRELMLTQRLTQAQARRNKENQMRIDQHRLQKVQQKKSHQKCISRLMAKDCLKSMWTQSFQMLRDQGFIRDDFNTLLKSDCVPWLFSQVQEMVHGQRAQRKDLDTVYVQISQKGKNAHTQSLENEKQRIADIIQGRIDAAQFKIDLKAAKLVWSKGVQIFRQKEQLEKEIEDQIIEDAREQHFNLGLRITDLDDYQEDDAKLVCPGGLVTEFMMIIEGFNKQFQTICEDIEKQLSEMQTRERKKAQKEEKYKIKPNPLLDPKIVASTFILFIKEQCKGNFTFPLPETSQQWVEYKQSVYHKKPQLYLAEKEALIEQCLTQNKIEQIKVESQPVVEKKEKNEPNSRESYSEELPFQECPQKFFKSSYYLMKDNKMLNNELVIKPILTLMFDILFLYERHKPEKRSKESTSNREASLEGEGKEEGSKEAESRSKEEEGEQYIPMTKLEYEIIELKDLVQFCYAPTLNKDNQLDAIVRIQRPINLVPPQEHDSSTHDIDPKLQEKEKIRLTNKEKERQELEEIERNIEKRRQRKEQKKKQFLSKKTMQIDNRNERANKLLEDYDVNKLEHFYGTKFKKELDDEGKGFFDINNDLENKRVVLFNMSQINHGKGEGKKFGYIHHRCSHLIRQAISSFLKIQYKQFEHIKDEALYEMLQKNSDIIEKMMEREMVINKDMTPVYDFECSHDRDRNFPK